MIKQRKQKKKKKEREEKKKIKYEKGLGEPFGPAKETSPRPIYSFPNRYPLSLFLSLTGGPHDAMSPSSSTSRRIFLPRHRDFLPSNAL
jgi:hypothetical protein